jgi:prepilin-type N-terminal cleavage/methylation domain-containing protein
MFFARKAAFTLAELLIALTILGVISTFTIPKVLNSQQNQQFNAGGKETAAMISEAFILYQKDNVVTSSTKNGDLTQYFNYVSVDTSTVIDNQPLGNSLTCGSSGSCLKLHNGGILLYCALCVTSGTGSTNALTFYWDPDGKYSGSTTGPSKSVRFFLYANGRLTTRANVLPNTIHNTDPPYNPSVGLDPDWLVW